MRLGKLSLMLQLQFINHLSIEYGVIKFDEGFRADIFIEKVILELKSVESLTKIDRKQVLTYLRLAEFPPGNAVRTGKLG